MPMDYTHLFDGGQYGQESKVHVDEFPGRCGIHGHDIAVVLGVLSPPEMDRAIGVDAR